MIPLKDPWPTVYQQTDKELSAVFEEHNLARMEMNVQV